MKNSIKNFHFVFLMASLTKNLVEFSTDVVFLFFSACSSSILVISTVLLNATTSKVSVRVRVVLLDPESVSEGN